jgi:hypothetical protein
MAMSARQARGIGRQKTGNPQGGRRGLELGENHGTVHQALHDIQYIRDIIDASREFFVTGWSGVVAGAITVAGAVLSAWVISHPGRWEVSRTLWVLWIVIGLTVGSSNIFFFTRSSRRAARPVLSPLFMKIGLAKLIIVAQGIILTVVLIKIGAPAYIPGAWLLVYGTAVTALGLFFPGGLWVMGLAIFFASVAAFVVPGGGIWCVGFGGVALCLWGAAYLIRRGK